VTSPVRFERAITDPITLTYATTITPDAATGALFRVVATGNLTLNDPTGGVDGQWVRVEITASGASRTLTLAGITPTVTIASGARWAGDLVYDGTDWWLDDGAAA
jgi:hypothetical protein